MDDSKTVRIIVRKTFRLHPWDIIEAENGQEGLEVASRERPDLIFLDITMPVMDGIEMLSRLKSNPDLSAIPVIMLTAETGRDQILRVKLIGAAGFIMKPFRGQELIEESGRYLGDTPPETHDPHRAQNIS